MAWFASWLWEGVVIVLLVSAMLRGLRRVDAATRYAIWWGTLLAIICWPAVTLTRLLAHNLLTASPSTVHTIAATGRRHWVEVTVPSAPVWALRAVVALWLATVIWKLSRLGIACWQVRRVKRSCAAIDARALERLPLWRQVSQRGRRAELCISDRVGVACALGFRRPIIALPRPFLTQLAPRDLDQVALHEYAHLQRRDDWARLVQLAVEAICGWHPAIRWISRQLTFEREVACDDWVVQRTRDPLGYARCLTRLAERTVAGQATTLSPAAWSTEAVVVRRVRRVLDARRDGTPFASRWRLAVAVAVVALCAGEAGRVFALQEATDRIVASTPIVGGTLTAAVTAQAFGGIAPMAAIDSASAISMDAVPVTGLPFASRVSSPAAAASASSSIRSSVTAANAHADRPAIAAAVPQAVDEPAAASSSAPPEPADHTRTPVEASASPLLPAVQHALAPHVSDENSSSTPPRAFAPLDLTATRDDLVLDDDGDHEVTPPALEQPAHGQGAVHARPVRPRTRGTGFFARVGRSIVHILGTHTRSPGGLDIPNSRRRRASRALLPETLA